MAYGDFKLEQVLDKFSLSLIEQDLFETSVDIHPSKWLIEILDLLPYKTVKSTEANAGKLFSLILRIRTTSYAG